MLRAALSPAIHWLARVSGYSVRKAHAAPVGRVLMLHAVGPAALAGHRLDALLAWLERNFLVLPLGELLDRVHGPRGFSGREVALTFDDGQRCHAETVAPLLLQRRLPATFFVCPQLIASGRWIWNLEARLRLRSLSSADRREALAAGAAPAGVSAAAPEAAIAWLKTLTPEPREAALAAIRAATRAWEPSPAEQELWAPMSLEALRRLDPSMIEIGSHTLTHPILPTLGDAQLEREVGESRVQLEQWLGRPVTAFCFPNGAQDERVRAAAARHYRVAVTTEPGHLARDADLHRVPRVGVEGSLSATAWRMLRP